VYSKGSSHEGGWEGKDKFVAKDRHYKQTEYGEERVLDYWSGGMRWTHEIQCK